MGAEFLLAAVAVPTKIAASRSSVKVSKIVSALFAERA